MLLRPHWTAPLAVLAGCVASIGWTPSSAAAASLACVPAHAKVVRETSSSVISRQRGFGQYGERYVGCLRSTRRGVSLFDEPFHGSVLTALSGRYAAMTVDECSHYEPYGCFESRVGIWDLRRHRRVTKDTYGDRTAYAQPLDLKLGRSGRAVYTLRIGGNVEVWTLRRGRSQREAADPDIDPTLTKDDGSVWWSVKGQRAVGIPVD